MANVVYQQLRAALMEGVFEAGTTFAILEIAERFGTSNTPVREALRRLTAEGALVEGKWNSATLPPLSAVSYSELCTARAVIESATAGLAANTINDQGIADLHAISARHQAALREGRIADMLTGNKDFHFTLYRAAGNRLLIEQIEALWLRSGPYTRYLAEKMNETLKAEEGLSYARHHDELMVALEARDPEAARRAIADDITSMHNWTSRFLDG